MHLSSYLSEKEIQSKENISLKRRTPIRIGSTAEQMIFPDTKEKLTELLRFLDVQKIPYRVVGRFTNLCPGDTPCRMLLICTEKLTRTKQRDSGIYAECGVSLAALGRSLMDIGRLSFPELVSIPGTLGGAVYGNAGAFGREIGEYLTMAEVYDPTSGTIHYLSARELGFSYRSSLLKQEGGILLSAFLQTTNNPAAAARYAECLTYRKTTQPLSQKSLGSAFLRANGISAGYYIDRADCKGLRIGGAAVSTKHAGFIVNTGEATAADVKALMAAVSDRVEQTFSLRLTPEIQFLD